MPVVSDASLRSSTISTGRPVASFTLCRIASSDLRWPSSEKSRTSCDLQELFVALCWQTCQVRAVSKHLEQLRRLQCMVKARSQVTQVILIQNRSSSRYPLTLKPTPFPNISLPHGPFTHTHTSPLLNSQPLQTPPGRPARHAERFDHFLEEAFISCEASHLRTLF